MTWLVPLLGVPKRYPLRNREMGRTQALGGHQSFNKRCNQPKDSVGGWGGDCLRRDTNEGNGNKDGGQATAMRAMVRATAMAMTWVMAMATRLAGDKERKGEGNKGNGNGNEGGRGQRG